jgi:DNA-binding PadR family transcriptional regulator
MHEMSGRGYLGSFELMVLLVVIRHGENAYGVTISRALEESTQRSVALRSVYAALDRLEDKGFVSSRLGDPTPERGGRAKRYFRVTAQGLDEARSTQHALSALWSNPPTLEGDPA